MTTYLNSGHALIDVRGFDYDRVAPDSPRTVTLDFLTDGNWIWNRGIAYYARTYGLHPEVDFCWAAALAEYVISPVADNVMQQATAFLFNQQALNMHSRSGGDFHAAVDIPGDAAASKLTLSPTRPSLTTHKTTLTSAIMDIED